MIRSRTMHIVLTCLLFTSVILQNGNGAISFDTHAYALAHPCVWSACQGLPSEDQNFTATCCTLQVPLNYAKPNQSLISISMVRLSPPIPNGNTLFLLNGGPGEAGLGLLSVLEQLIPAENGITMIFPDHRGTGLSSPLGCDDQNSQTITMDCIQYLKNRWTVEGLNQFSTTSAAHDLAIQIQAFQSTGRMAILAVSYGTYWLNRFLDIYPNLVQVAVMDSPLNPLLHSFSQYGVRASYVVNQFLTYCTFQAECIRHFPNDPPAIMLYKILQQIDSNQQQCINTNFARYSLTSGLLRSTLFPLFQSAQVYYDRTVIPAVIFRLNRCNQEDVAALISFFQARGLSPPSSSNESSSGDTNSLVLNSNALYYNIAFSELWLSLNQSDVDQQTLDAWQNTTIIAPDNPPDLIALKQAWPKYLVDEYRYHIANSTVLMMASQLDGATPLDLASHLVSITGKTRTLYSIPLSGHIISLFVTVTGYTCPLQLILSWTFPALFPSAWSDPSCIQDLPTTIDFVGATAMGQESSLKLLNVTLPFGSANNSQSGNGVSSACPSLSFVLILCLAYVSRFLSGTQ